MIIISIKLNLSSLTFCPDSQPQEDAINTERQDESQSTKISLIESGSKWKGGTRT
jgi:hypothetical protein